MENIKLKIITQNKIVYEGEANAFYTDAQDGRIGILPNHLPITCVLKIGVTKIITDKEPIFVTTMGGVMHFNNNEAVILTDIAELGDDIDEVRAHDAYERAKARIAAQKDKLDVLRAQVALQKAIARISATGKHI